MTTPLSIEAHGAVEIATLDRPGRLNAMDETLITALSEYFTGLAARPEVRVVLLAAAGRAFCAGLDLEAWQNDGSRGALQHGWHVQRSIATVMQRMRACPQPIIALAQGAACGGGFSLLLASDVRIAAPSLRMNAAYIKVGLGGCDMGSSYFLPRLVGASLAAEYLYTGRFMDAETALRCHLVSRIVAQDDLRAAGLALADEMLATAPMGLRLSKDALNRNIDAPSFEAALAIEDRQQVMMLMSEDHREAVRAFLDKRPPVYRDR